MAVSVSHEEFGTTVHMGSIESKALRDEIRWTLRDILLTMRTRLGKTTVQRERDELTIKARKLSLSMAQNGWVHYGVELENPISLGRLALANKLSNDVASFLNAPLRRHSKVGITSNISTRTSIRPMTIRKFFLNESIGRLDRSLGMKLTPSGAFLINEKGPERNSVVLTTLEGRTQIMAVIYRPSGDEIPRDFVRENYKVTRDIVNKIASAL